MRIVSLVTFFTKVKRNSLQLIEPYSYNSAISNEIYSRKICKLKPRKCSRIELERELESFVWDAKFSIMICVKYR